MVDLFAVLRSLALPVDRGKLKAGNAAGLSLAWIARWPHSVLTIAHFLKGSMQCLPLYCALCDQAQCYPYHERGLLLGPESPSILGVTMATGDVRRAGALVLFEATSVDVGTVGTPLEACGILEDTTSWASHSAWERVIVHSL